MVSYDWTNGRSSCCRSARREVFIVFHCQVVSTSYIFSYLNFKFFIFAGKRESLGKLKWKQQRLTLVLYLVMEWLYLCNADNFSPWHLFVALSGRIMLYHFQYKGHELCMFLFLHAEIGFIYTPMIFLGRKHDCP